MFRLRSSSGAWRTWSRPERWGVGLLVSLQARYLLCHPGRVETEEGSWMAWGGCNAPAGGAVGADGVVLHVYPVCCFNLV
jgi:hypothetical protein